MQLGYVEDHDLEFLASVAVFEDSVDEEVLVGPHVAHRDILLLIASLTSLLLDCLLFLTAYLFKLLCRDEPRIEVRPQVRQLLFDKGWNHIGDSASVVIDWLLRQELRQEILSATRVSSLRLSRYVQRRFTVHVLDERNDERLFAFLTFRKLQEVLDELVVLCDAVEHGSAVWQDVQAHRLRDILRKGQAERQCGRLKCRLVA